MDIIAKEIKRVIKKYGPIRNTSPGRWARRGQRWCTLPMGVPIRLLEPLGGYTLQIRNPDSWEGWYWGAKHVWGMEPVGMMTPYQTNIYPGYRQEYRYDPVLGM